MVTWPNGKALDYESRDCRFDPCRDLLLVARCRPPVCRVANLLVCFRCCGTSLGYHIHSGMDLSLQTQRLVPDKDYVDMPTLSILLNQLRHLLRNRINRALQMRPRNQRNNTRIHDPQILRPPDPRPVIHHASQLLRLHRIGTARMIHRTQLPLLPRPQLRIGAHLRPRRQLRRPQLLQRLCRHRPPHKPHTLRYKIKIHWIRAVT